MEVPDWAGHPWPPPGLGRPGLGRGSDASRRTHAILPPMPEADANAPYLTRVDFVVELARRLHAYGTSAQRLEGAVTQVARRLQLDADVWSNPTGMLLSFADI